MTPSQHRELQIAEVLLRYGLGHLLEGLGLERLVAYEHRILHRGPKRTEPERLRLALEELGPTFIKLGQVLSTRSDLLGPEYQTELARLQDSAPPVPPQQIEEIIRRELRASTATICASFDMEPLAAASIGQAHAATLPDGTEVVVKIRRPGVVEAMEQDLAILRKLAARAARHWEEAARWNVPGLTDEFARALRAELDYRQEAQNASRFAANFAGHSDVHIPAVVDELTTSSVITLERIRGIKITDLAALDAAGLDRHALAERAAGVVAKMVLQDGFFHGDPHPGNFLIEPGGRIGLIDFGRVGVINDELRPKLNELLGAVILRNPERLTNAVIGITVNSGAVDRPRLRADLSAMLSRNAGQDAHQNALGRTLAALFQIVRRHGLTFVHNLALLFTTIIMEEGISATLDPEFRFEQALAPYVARHLMRAATAAEMASRAEQFGVDLAELAFDFPSQLHQLIETIGEGRLELHLRASELEPLMARAERLGNRIAASVLAVAIVDVLSQLAAGNTRGRGWRSSLAAAGLGLAGFGLAVSFRAGAGGRRSGAGSAASRLLRRARRERTVPG